ncbi:hypothetical protein Tco_1207212 [Tanacetum coccineum]
MNPQEIQQVTARDEKWVPSTERAFTIFAHVPEIFMKQFWYTINNVKESESYEFLLANKKCIIDAEVFRKILDISVQEWKSWRTLAAIINKCLFGKTTSNDKQRKSKIDILWGMFYRENVDYPELIWEGFAFQIDHKKEKKSRHETMPFPQFTKVIINHFLKQHKSLSNLKYQHYHTIKDDGIVSKLKFVRIGKDYQEYGLAIPDVMLIIKQSESYQMFIKYSTSEIPPKKSRGKGSQGKKTVDVSQETVDVSEESEPKPAKKRTASRRVVKKKVTISVDDNIIPDPNVALELGKSISITKAEEKEAARQVHATHATIVTESDLNLKPIRRKLGTGGSSEGTGRILGVPDESTAVSATSSEGTGTKQGVLDEEKVSTKEKVILEWGSEQESEYLEEDLSDEEEIDWIDSKEDDEKKDDIDDDKSIDLEMTDDEETDDEVLQGKEKVNDDEDEEMTNAKVEESRNVDEEEDSNAAKADAEKTEEAKDDSKNDELPPTSSSLSISSGFGDQFLKLSSDTSLIGTVKDITDANISSLLDIKIQYEVPHIQSSSVLKVTLFVISKASILTSVQETPSATPVTTLPPPSISTIPPAPLQQSIAPIPLPPIITDAPTITTTVLQRYAADLIQKYSVKPTPGLSKIQTSTINLEQEFKKSALEILKIKKEQVEKQKMPKYTIKSTDKAALKEYDQKSILYQTMMKMPYIRELLTQSRTIKQSMMMMMMKTLQMDQTREPVEEPIAEVVMDDVGEDVVHDDDQPQDTSKPKMTKTPNPELFKQPPRCPTPDLEWNKRQVALGEPKQPWFN